MRKIGLYFQPKFNSYGLSYMDEKPKWEKCILLLNCCNANLTPRYNYDDQLAGRATSTKPIGTMEFVRVLADDEIQSWMLNLYSLA